MNEKLLVKRSTFVTKCGFIHAFMIGLCCYGAPLLAVYQVGEDAKKIIQEVVCMISSNFYATALTIVMLLCPLVAMFVALFGKIGDYIEFNKNPKNIKAILFTKYYMNLYYNSSAYDKVLYYDELTAVKMMCKKIYLMRPGVAKGYFKLGGFGLMAAGTHATERKPTTYEMDLVMQDKAGEIYNFTVSAEFSFNPISTIKNIEMFFADAGVNYFSNITK